MSITAWATVGTFVTVLTTACAPSRLPIAAAPAAREQRAEELAMVGTGDGIATLDWGAGRLVYRASAAVAAADGSRVVTTSGTGGDGSLDVLDARTGVRQGSVPVPAGLRPSVVATDGTRVALAAPRADAEGWQPPARESTQFVVADPSGAAPPRTFQLAGNYEPDAFSTDGRRLFVLEYLPPQAPDRYRVRQLDLTSGAIGGVLNRTKVASPEEDMRGTRGTHVLSPDRTTLYTLYTHQPDHLHSRDLAAGRAASSGEVHAFVHVLSLTQGWAYCLDLPQPFGLGSAAAHALAVSRNGRSLYVSDRSSGALAVADTSELVLQSISNVGPDGLVADAGLAADQVAVDGTLYLAGGSEVLAVEPVTLAVQRRLALPGPARGLAVSADGQRLYVSLPGRVAALDSTTGALLSSITLPGPERIEMIVGG